MSDFLSQKVLIPAIPKTPQGKKFANTLKLYTTYLLSIYLLSPSVCVVEVVLYAPVCVPVKVKNGNVKLFNLISGVKETRFLV